jgi:hypothetical protein
VGVDAYLPNIHRDLLIQASTNLYAKYGKYNFLACFSDYMAFICRLPVPNVM